MLRNLLVAALLAVAAPAFASVAETGRTPSCPSAIEYSSNNADWTTLDGAVHQITLGNPHDYDFASWTGNYRVTWGSGNCGDNGCFGGNVAAEAAYPSGQTTYTNVGNIAARCVTAKCSQKAGDDAGVFGKMQTYPDATTACLNHCQIQRYVAVTFTNPDGTEDPVYNWSYAGGAGQLATACGSSDHASDAASTTVPMNCIRTSGGESGCYGKENTKTATTARVGDANDVVKDGTDLGPSTATPSELEKTGCLETASGAVFCVADAPRTAVPDDGTAGEPANPQYLGTALQGLGGNTTNNYSWIYFNPATAASSTNYGTGGGTGQCPAGQTKNSNGTCSGTGACPSGQSKGADGKCKGAGDGNATGTVSGPAVGDAPTFSQTMQEARTRILNAPINQVATQIGNALPSGGSCPAPTFEMYGATLRVDGHCQLIEAYRPLLYAISLVLGCLAAIVVFFKA